MTVISRVVVGIYWTQVESVFRAVMTSLKRRIADVTWMDDDTRATALDKADAIVHKIGYPDFVRSPAELDQHYEQVSASLSGMISLSCSAADLLVDL